MSRSNLVSNNGISALSIIDCDLINTRNVKQINSLGDFTPPVGGIIYLEDNKTYFLTGIIDLQGNRIVCGENNVILGFSSENCKIKSTGLVGPLITSTKTLVLRHFTFLDNTAFDIRGDGTIALDWYGINFENIQNIGIVDNIANFIFNTGAFLNSNGLVFSTKADTISFSDCLFVSGGYGSSVLTIGGNITRRFRIILSSMVISLGDTGIDTTTANVLVESYILENINFTGAGTYLTGLSVSSVESLFLLCNNIDNSFVNGQVYMRNNAVQTIIPDTTNFYKILGTTTGSLNGQKTLLSNNRITIKAGIRRKYYINCILSFTSGANNVCSFGFYDSVLGTIRVPSVNNSTANAGGRAENVSLSCIVDGGFDDYFEVWCRNTSATTNIVVTDFNFMLIQI